NLCFDFNCIPTPLVTTFKSETEVVHLCSVCLHLAETKPDCLCRGRLGSVSVESNSASAETRVKSFIKYVKELLKKLKLDDCKSIFTPMHPTSILTVDHSDKKVDQTTYRADPRESHLIVVRSIFIYLKDTTNLGLWFKKSYKHRQVRDKAPLPYPLQKHSTYLFLADALNFFRSSINLKTTTYLRVAFLYFKVIFDIKFINTNEKLTHIFTKPLLEDKLIHISKHLRT
ncbi:hypothetical protein CR513_21212, partial [Mucuna pruriens]